ncbi:MAG: hypothetical protein JJU07_06215 [Natronohydrobacter sp.]|nr:hypothetical protein [Natronohydrobacter sp.]
MRIIAHRGGSAHAPENTLAAFDNAIAMGVRDFEFDLRLAADGEVVVIHDATLERTTTGSGPVAEATSAHIRTLDAGGWFGPEFRGTRVPTLAEVLARYSADITLHIELKGESLDLVQAVLRQISDADAFGRCWVTAFNADVIDALRAGSSALRLSRLLRKGKLETGAALRAAGVQMVSPHLRDTTPDLVAQYHAAGLLVRPWGLKGDIEAFHRLAGMGVFGCTFSDLKAGLAAASAARAGP